MALRIRRTLPLPEQRFRDRLAGNYLHDPGFLAFQKTHGTGATYPEYLVWFWLTKKAGAEEYRDFYYQLSFGGGRTMAGGLVADFIINPPITVRQTWLEVYGVAFHTSPVRRGPESLAADRIRREFALGNHFDFVRVLDTDLVNRLDYTMRAAIVGVEIGAFPS